MKKNLTMTGQVGTPVYMAPELLFSERANLEDGPTKVDVYSFGVLMWTMWVRKLPYQDLIERSEVSNAFQLAARVASGVRPSLTFSAEKRGAGGIRSQACRIKFQSSWCYVGRRCSA